MFGYSFLLMNQKSLKLHLVLVVTSQTAFLQVNGLPSAIRATESLRNFWPTIPLTVATSPEFAAEVTGLFAEKKIAHELLICQPTKPSQFLQALLPKLADLGAFVIHDASRPLTHPDLFVRALSALHNGADAVRPAIAFTETLKIVEPSGVIRQTLDRTSVRHISTPEIIRISALDINGADGDWFLPLRAGTHVEHIEGSPDGLRINSEAERDLLESFLHWRQLNI